MFKSLTRCLLLLFTLTLAISCSPEKRIARILKNNPHLIKSDTITRLDTIISQSVSRDTTFFYNTKDSVIIREGRLIMKYFYNDHDSTVYLQGQCLPDTIIREIPIQVNSVSVEESKCFLGTIKEYLIYILLVGIILLLLFNK